jgi:FixJ family two-component response regulator
MPALTDSVGSVVIVEDDASMRQALEDLLNSVGLQTFTYATVPEFLAAALPPGPCCIVLDVRLPGYSGLDLQQDLAKSRQNPPVIIMTGHGDIAMSVQAMKAGAVEFLVKPFRDQDLLDALHAAIERHRAQLDENVANERLLSRFATLTPREQEVMEQVVTGRLNKQIAADLGLSDITVKVHRGQAMRKMGARSLADLVRMADRLSDIRSSGSA